MNNHFQDESIIWITDTLRRFPEHRERLLDCFWRGQIESKAWLIDVLNLHVINKSKRNNIYIFGGWYGVLASMLFASADFSVEKIRSIDINPECEAVADHVNKIYEMAEWRFKAFTASMDEWDYDHNPTIVINTSTEHITQEVYDKWFDKIPKGTMVVLQGNDFFACGEHIRCSKNLDEFIQQSGVDNVVYSGEFKADSYSNYNRYMVITIK
jgi:hypothetical protein